MSTLLAPILQYFFTEHLTSHKQVSPRTIVAYRDSFRLLLQFLKKKTGKQPSTLFVDDLDASAILDFLEHLEEQRDNQICSRNARLTAIRSFFHVVALRDPASVGVVNRVLAIPRKRTDKHAASTGEIRLHNVSGIAWEGTQGKSHSLVGKNGPCSPELVSGTRT